MLKMYTRQISINLLALLMILSYCKIASAGPWFTGPLLAPAGHTIPRGHTNLEMYGFYTVNEGVFNRHWKLIHTPGSESIVGDPIFSHGLTDRIDIQYAVPYAYNRNQGKSSQRISDVSAVLGYQLIEQKDSKWIPDLRVTLQEVIPTGKHDRLNSLNNGADGTGLGSYQTGLALNFQHLLQLGETHYLRSRLSLSYLYASPVDLNGLSVYGGTPLTRGTIRPGNLSSVDVAAELTLTQNWVAVMESYVANRGSTRFSGSIGNDALGRPGTIGHGSVDEITLAPAVEYNFSPNIGLIAGPWFTLAGRETSDFISYVVALNAYW